MRRPLHAVMGLSVAVGLALLAAAARPSTRATGDHPVEVKASLEARLREADIALFQRRAAEDPWSAADRARLASLYLQRARESGSQFDLQRAESLAVSALRLRESRNEDVLAVLAGARLALHDFTGALDAARTLVARDSTEPLHRALLGEVLLELGDYDAAGAIFRPLERETSRLSVAVRLARWYELTGRLRHARNVMRHTLRRVLDEGRSTSEQEAWVHLRLGEIELKAGAVERAESLFVDGLRRFPNDYRLLGALAAAAARREDWGSVIEAGERAIAIHLEPATLGLLSEAYASLGDWMQSASYARALRASALSQPGPIHRAWGLFLLDHGYAADGVLTRARRELDTRRDVYGYDLVAWALHARGRNEEAWFFMERALTQGTEDALLWYHAARIAEANGNIDAARHFASRAMALNPRFHPVHADQARRIADETAVTEEAMARTSGVVQ